MKKTIYCPDIECDSCVRVIDKLMVHLSGINSYFIKNDSLFVDFDESLIRFEIIVNAIKEKGYRVFEQKQKRSRIRARLKEFVKDKAKYKLEYRFIKYVSITIIMLLALQIIFTSVLNKYIPGYFSSTFIWLFYLTLIVVSIGGAIWHFKSYRSEVTCMVGMMIGMTVGMQTGMMLGPILATTIGFAPGATIAMIAGAIVGSLMGKCCGIMGLMEGLMAGIMGGVMGGMIGAMMMANLMWFMPIYLGLNLIVIAGMIFMVFEEIVEGKDFLTISPLSFWKFFVYNFIVVFILTGIVYLSPIVLPSNIQEMSMGMEGMEMGEMMGMNNMKGMEGSMENMETDKGMMDNMVEVGSTEAKKDSVEMMDTVGMR